MVTKLDTPELLDSLGFFQDNNYVLDIGCGIAPIAKYCIRSKKNIWYHGLDIVLDRIKICRTLHKDIRYSFSHLSIYSETYNPKGKLSPENFDTQLPDKYVDAVICHSLFTHLDTKPVAKRYIKEIKRVLRKGGILWTTWFSSPPNSNSDGTRRTVYELDFIHELLSDFEPIYQSGGETTGYHDQLEIACVKG